MDASSPPSADDSQMPPPSSLPGRSGDHNASVTPESSTSRAGTPGSRVSRPRRAARPSTKAMLARENSPDAWEHGGRSSRPARATPSGSRPQIKVKMRATGGGAGGVGQGPKTKPYMQGYDRELDSEDDETGEGLAFEEQLILRMPEGPECEMLREAVSKRQVGDDVWFKFKDSRRAVFHAGDTLFSAKLVDLPSIIESHKTLDNRQFFKVADISQMLLVEDRIQDESQASSSASGRGFNIDDFIYPHGITPPMKWARKRRFRKRAARRAIETVEKEVERLLKEDKKAEKIEYEVFDTSQGIPSDLEDEGGEDGHGGSPAATDADGPSRGDRSRQFGSDDEGTQMGEGEEMDASQMGSDEDDGGSRGDFDDDEVDEDLAAELDAALEEESDEGESTRAGSEARSRASDQEDLWDDDDDDDGEDDEDDDDDEDESEEEKERRVREAQLEAECREIEALVRRKQADVDSTMNLIIKNRHQQALRKLTVERDIKRGQLADIKQARKERKEANAAAAEEEETKRREKDEAAAAAAAAAAAVAAGAGAGGAKPSSPSKSKSAEPQTAAGEALPGNMPPPSAPLSRAAQQSSPPSTPMDVDANENDDDDLWEDGDEDE